MAQSEERLRHQKSKTTSACWPHDSARGGLLLVRSTYKHVLFGVCSQLHSFLAQGIFWRFCSSLCAYVDACCASSSEIRYVIQKDKRLFCSEEG